MKEKVSQSVRKVADKVSAAGSKAKSAISNVAAKLPRRSKVGKVQSIRVNQNLAAKVRSKKDLKARRKAEYMASLPKGRVKRFFYRLHPKRLARYWFSKEGGIMALKIAGFSFLAAAILIAAVFAYFRKDLPKNITDLRACSLGQTIKFYDRTGTVLLWSGAGDVDCRPVPLKDVSPYLRDAVIASEDQSFYTHHGFDPKGLFNAAIDNATSGGGGRGGSTITQQYVKLALLSSERTLTRKIKELILAVELDASYKKDEILQAYLNEIGFAYQYNGAEAAARGLFDKSAKDLTLDEAAIMAAGIPSPDYYWVQDNEALENRKHYVLDQMVGMGKITKDEAEAAKKIDTLAKVNRNKSQYKDIKAPHFVLEVFNQLKEEYGKDVTKLGFEVRTTLNMDLQKIAEESVANGFACRGGLGIDCLGNFDNAAFVAEDVENGQVVAMVGSRDFNIPGYGQLNIATTPRSPGSSFKPYDYAALMKSSENWGAGSILYDLRTNFGGNYRPENYDGREPGGVSMRYALGGSRNIPAIKAMYAAGIEYTHQVAIDLGIKDGIINCAGAPKCEGILSTAIGDGGQVRLDQHVHGYASLSRLGKNIPQAYILEIKDAKGKSIRKWEKEEGKQALDPQIAYIISDMLSDRNASYFRGNKGYRDRVSNNFEAMEIPAAMKTGTTNNFENGWIMGYTKKYAGGVWIGNHENKSSVGRGYENATTPIWGEFMRRAHELLPEKPGKWEQPAGIKTVAHPTDFFNAIKSKCTGAQLGNVCGFGQSDIYPSWYIQKTGGSGKKAIIDTISNKLATECTPELAKKEITSGNIMPEISSSDPNYRNWLAPIAARYGGIAGGAIPVDKDDKHSCSDVKPTVTDVSVSGSNGVYVISATVTQGTHPLQTLNFKIDGQTIPGGSLSISGSGTYEVDYFSSSAGSHDVSAQAIDTLLYEYTIAPESVNFTAVPALNLNALPGTLSWSWSGPAPSVTTYDIYLNGNKVGSDSSSPYNTIQTGSWQIRAIKNGQVAQTSNTDSN